MSQNKHTYFYVLIFSLFLGISAFNLFSDGMFMDGLFYADISRNMAEGIGSFWQLHLTYGLPDFFGQPPLVFGLQSLGFKIFGDSILVERFYSLLTFIITSILVVLIWEKLTNNKSTGWIPLFFLIMINDISWSVSNNMLENTMSIFVALSFLFYLNSHKKHTFWWIILSGCALSAGLLSKGFFCLYIWASPFFFWLFKREISFSKMALQTMALIVSTLLPIALLYFFIPAAQNNMIQYVNQQVIHSIENVETVGSRFSIIKMFFENILVNIILTIIIIAITGRKRKYHLRKNRIESLMLLSIVLSGVLPIMVSMKQRSFYILTVYPIFAVSLAYYLYPLLKPSIDKIKKGQTAFNILKFSSLTLAVVSITLSVYSIGKVGRDKDLISDSKSIVSTVGDNKIIGLSPDLYDNWSLHGYCSRYGKVSLDANPNSMHQYDFFLMSKSGNIPQNFKSTDVELTSFRLCKKINPKD